MVRWLSHVPWSRAPKHPSRFARVHDEARAAHAALRQAGEQVLRAPALVEALAPSARLRTVALHACVSRLRRLPQLVVDDAQLRARPSTIHSTAGFEPRHALAGVRILHVPQAVPDQPADVQLVVQDAGAALRVAVDRARTPQRRRTGRGRLRDSGPSRSASATRPPTKSRKMRRTIAASSGYDFALARRRRRRRSSVLTTR